MNAVSEKTNWRVYLKHNQGILLIGVLLFLYGIWMDIQWFSERPSGILYFLNLLPGILLLFTWYLASKYQKRRWVIIILGMVITAIMSLYVVFINAITGAFVAATTPVTDVAQYSEIRKQVGDAELTRHFPLSIPGNAENVHFEYLPRFLQGGGHFQLRMKLPLSEINDLQTQFRLQAKYKFEGGNTNDHANMEGGVPTTFFYTSGTDKHSFQSDYEILVLDAVPGGTPDFEWNHGHSYGVVVSVERAEIIYWAEYW